MKITKKDVKGEGSCNYCDKGVITKGVLGLDYPYATTFHVDGFAISTRFCNECLIDLMMYAIKNREPYREK